MTVLVCIHCSLMLLFNVVAAVFLVGIQTAALRACMIQAKYKQAFIWLSDVCCLEKQMQTDTVELGMTETKSHTTFRLKSTFVI